MKIFHHAIIDSTNDECFRRFASGEVLPFAVIADEQTRGRGQFGRAWYSLDRQNLYISFAFLPRYSPQEFQYFSIKVAEKLSEKIFPYLGITLDVKPPNDLYFQGKKVGGILTESKISDQKVILAVTGIGINIAGKLEKFPEDLKSTATVLNLCCAKNLEVKTVANLVVEAMTSLIL